MALSLTYTFTNVISPYTFNLPLSGTSDAVTIDWGFGLDRNEIVPAGSFTQEYPHDYYFTDISNVVTITVNGSGIQQLSQNLNIGNNPSAPFLTSCNSFGEIGLTNLDNAFLYCSTLTSVPSTLPPSIVYIRSMFDGATSFNGDLSLWNVSGITDMTAMFYNATSFDGDLSSWDFSGVTDMSFMFAYASAFTGKNIDQWNVTSTTTIMRNMFYNTTSFDGDLSSWDFSGVTDMSGMFESATSFTGKNIDQWNVTSTTTDINTMFNNATKFNGNLSSWDVSGASMGTMLDNSGMTVANYNATLIGWANKGYSSNSFEARGLIYSNEAAAARMSFAKSLSVGDLYIHLPLPIYKNSSPFNVTYNVNTPPGITCYIEFNNNNSLQASYSSDSKLEFTNVSFNPPIYDTTNDISIRMYTSNTDPKTTIFSGLLKSSDLTIVCFNEGTKILYLNQELFDEYVPIEDLQLGNYVKTYKHGYRKISKIIKGSFRNNTKQWNMCMYKMTKTKSNKLLEDLIVTGGHSLLVDSISKTEQAKYDKMGLTDFSKETIDGKRLLLACVSEQFAPMPENEVYTYYHLLLENNNDDEERFGIWANGILTETPSNDFVKKQFIL